MSLTLDEMKSKVAAEYNLRQAYELMGKDDEGVEKIGELLSLSAGKKGRARDRGQNRFSFSTRGMAIERR